MEKSFKQIQGKNIEAERTPQQVLIVQIPREDIFDEVPTPSEAYDDDGPIKGLEKKPKSSWWKRQISPQLKDKSGKTVGIRMTKEEFMAYFARDEKTGDYKKGVVEPPEGRRAWLQKRLPENDREVWDLQLRESRQLASTRGIGYLGGIASGY